MQENVTRCRDLTDLVKNIVLGFCKINVQYNERLDIYGSLHIRADGRDVANFMLNEHCYNNSRTSSPTVTSAPQVCQESESNDDNSQSRHVQKNLEDHAVKMEPSVGNGENQSDSTDTNLWQWPDAESMTSQQQSASFSRPLYSSTQPVSAWSSNSSPHNSSAVSKYLVPGNVSDVKTEPAVSDNLLLNDDTIEILDDDPTDCIQDDDCVANESETAEFKPEFFNGADDYGAEMPYEYENYQQYTDSTATADQYSNVSASGYFRKQPRPANSAKRPSVGRPCKASLPSVGRNITSNSEKVCDYCQERFASDAELSAHFIQYHQCTMPPAESRQRKHRKTHVDQVPGSQLAGNPAEIVVQMYKCRVCGQIFRSRDGLNNHENVKHSGSRRYRCNFCSEEFLTRQSAYLHRVKFHRLLVRKMQ